MLYSKDKNNNLIIYLFIKRQTHPTGFLRRHFNPIPVQIKYILFNIKIITILKGLFNYYYSSSNGPILEHQIIGILL